MFRRTKSTKSAEVQQASLAAAGRPIPSRREAEGAARARAKAPRSRKELAQAQRADRAQASRKMREALRTGDDRNLPPRDQGPVRRFIRDFVDSRISFMEILLPVMVLVMVLTYSGSAMLARLANSLFLTVLLLVVLDIVRLLVPLRRELTGRFLQRAAWLDALRRDAFDAAAVRAAAPRPGEDRAAASSGIADLPVPLLGSPGWSPDWRVRCCSGPRRSSRRTRSGPCPPRRPGWARSWPPRSASLACCWWWPPTWAASALHAVAIWLLPLYSAQAAVAGALPVSALVAGRIEATRGAVSGSPSAPWCPVWCCSPSPRGQPGEVRPPPCVRGQPGRGRGDDRRPARGHDLPRCSARCRGVAYAGSAIGGVAWPGCSPRPGRCVRAWCRPSDCRLRLYSSGLEQRRPAVDRADDRDADSRPRAALAWQLLGDTVRPGRWRR
ncbi:MAG: DUF3043 domain-containing protein [Nocardioides sp.]